MTSSAFVIMGVSGCGKSSLARRLFQHFSGTFLEGDDFHPPANIRKMSQGDPLDDADRRPWLEALSRELSRPDLHSPVFLACSALKFHYREILRSKNKNVWFIHLTASRETLLNRLSSRQNHFMPASLLQSQLDTLEPLRPDEGICLSGENALETLSEQARAFVETKSIIAD